MKTEARIPYTLHKDELALTQTKKPIKNQLCFAIMLKHLHRKVIKDAILNCGREELIQQET